MKWFNCIVVYLIIVIIYTSSVDGKGGGRGGGGRGSGRGGRGRSSGRGHSWFSSGSSHSHSSGGGGRGNWFSRVFNSPPGGTTYVPIFIPHSHHTSGHSSYSSADKPAAEIRDDSKTVVAGYALGRALSSDFYSLFNVLSGILKYADDRKEYALENAMKKMTKENIAMDTNTDQMVIIEAATEQQIPIETTTEHSSSIYYPYSNILTNWDQQYNERGPLDINKDLFQSPIETTPDEIHSNESLNLTEETNRNVLSKYLGIDVSEFNNLVSVAKK